MKNNTRPFMYTVSNINPPYYGILRFKTENFTSIPIIKKSNVVFYLGRKALVIGLQTKITPMSVLDEKEG